MGEIRSLLALGADMQAGFAFDGLLCDFGYAAKRLEPE
jgi:hypothetical protein